VNPGCRTIMVARRIVPLLVALIASAGILLPGAARPASPSSNHSNAADALASARTARAGMFLGEYLHGEKTSGGPLLPVASPWFLVANGGWPGYRAPDLHASIGLASARDAAQDMAGIALLRRARAHVERGDATAALAVYDSATEALPHLRDWVDVFAASAAASAGDTMRVRQWQHRADPALQEWAWRAPVRAARQAGDRRLAIAKAEQAGVTLESPGRRASAWLLAGQLRLEGQDHAGARLAWIRAIGAAEGSASALEAAR
jgi:hypothetical protein